MKTVVGAVLLVAILTTGQPSRAQEATGSLLGTYYDAYLRLNAHEWALDLLVSIESEISPGCSLSELLPHSVGPVLPLDVDPATGQVVGGHGRCPIQPRSAAKTSGVAPCWWWITERAGRWRSPPGIRGPTQSSSMI